MTNIVLSPINLFFSEEFDQRVNVQLVGDDWGGNAEQVAWNLSKQLFKSPRKLNQGFELLYGKCLSYPYDRPRSINLDFDELVNVCGATSFLRVDLNYLNRQFLSLVVTHKGIYIATPWCGLITSHFFNPLRSWEFPLLVARRNVDLIGVQRCVTKNDVVEVWSVDHHKKDFHCQHLPPFAQHHRQVDHSKRVSGPLLNLFREFTFFKSCFVFSITYKALRKRRQWASKVSQKPLHVVSI